MTKLKILLVDDSRFFRTIEAQFLKKTPAEVVEADGQSALKLIRETQPDLVYMAYTLSPDDGPTCCEKIKQDPDLRDVPVVIICDQEDAEAQQLHARSKGCDETLVKPLDRLRFLQVGRTFLDGVREHRQPSFFRLSITVSDKTIAAKCLDISGGGMFIESKEEIPVGTAIDLSFKLPDRLSTLVECQGQVMWLNRRPDPLKPHYPHGFGLKFINLSSDAHTAITRLAGA